MRLGGLHRPWSFLFELAGIFGGLRSAPHFGIRTMSRANLPTRLVASVLDRLIDADAAISISDMKDRVKRDLQALLNTRSTYEVAHELADESVEVQQSLWTYGLPDFTAGAAGDDNERERLRRVIEETIRRFEPRLTHVRVKFVRPASEASRTLHFVIEAELTIHPFVEPVAFDTMVRPNNAQIEIK